MKNKKIWTVGLCGAICLSVAGFTYANALASDTPKVSTSETENTSGVDILYQDTDGGQISTDSKNWIAEADYEKNNTAPDVQWWTADEYEAWMNEQKKEMESLIGIGDGETYSMIPPTDDVVSDYSVDVITDNGQKVHIGNYSTVEELNEAISDAVKTGQLTQEEADAARQ